MATDAKLPAGAKAATWCGCRCCWFERGQWENSDDGQFWNYCPHCGDALGHDEDGEDQPYIIEAGLAEKALRLACFDLRKHGFGNCTPALYMKSARVVAEREAGGEKGEK